MFRIFILLLTFTTAGLYLRPAAAGLPSFFYSSFGDYFFVNLPEVCCYQPRSLRFPFVVSFLFLAQKQTADFQTDRVCVLRVCFAGPFQTFLFKFQAVYFEM